MSGQLLHLQFKYLSISISILLGINCRVYRFHVDSCIGAVLGVNGSVQAARAAVVTYMGGDHELSCASQLRNLCKQPGMSQNFSQRSTWHCYSSIFKKEQQLLGKET